MELLKGLLHILFSSQVFSLHAQPSMTNMQVMSNKPASNYQTSPAHYQNLNCNCDRSNGRDDNCRDRRQAPAPSATACSPFSASCSLEDLLPIDRRRQKISFPLHLPHLPPQPFVSRQPSSLQQRHFILPIIHIKLPLFLSILMHHKSLSRRDFEASNTTYEAAPPAGQAGISSPFNNPN